MFLRVPQSHSPSRLVNAAAYSPSGVNSGIDVQFDWPRQNGPKIHGANESVNAAGADPAPEAVCMGSMRLCGAAAAVICGLSLSADRGLVVVNSSRIQTNR